MKKVILYTTPNCMACRSVARTFEKKGVIFDTINLEQHPELVEQFKEVGLTSAPIVQTEGLTFSGYRPAKIEQLARKVLGS
jgi:glutaredoxin-like protein NrdH